NGIAVSGDTRASSAAGRAQTMIRPAHQEEFDMNEAKGAPEFREDDAWFSEEQLSTLTPADQAEDQLRSPIPLQMVSNGEYLPEPQTEQQKRIEIRLTELANEASKKLGIS